MKSVYITPEAFKTIKAHGEADYPDECCGFLIGTDQRIRSIEIAYEVGNSQPGDRRKKFEISPVDYMKAEKWADEKGFTLLGIYHSHPDHPAIPSRHDFHQAVPFFSYIIVSIRGKEFRKLTSWRLDEENKFIEEKIVVKQPELLKA